MISVAAVVDCMAVMTVARSCSMVMVGEVKVSMWMFRRPP
jgi:hypothetical protein